MSTKQTRRKYAKAFKEEAVALVTEQGYSVPKAAEAVGVAANLLYKWKEAMEAEKAGQVLSEDERAELKRLRKENRDLKLEKEILKNRLHTFIPHLTRNTIIATAGKWSYAFWRFTIPSKNLIQGNLRTRCWWLFIDPV